MWWMAISRWVMRLVVLDDLSRGPRRNLNTRFYADDIQDTQCLQQVFALEEPEVVNHHAAQMDVRRTVREPLLDARVNILARISDLKLGDKGVEDIRRLCSCVN